MSDDLFFLQRGLADTRLVSPDQLDPDDFEQVEKSTWKADIGGRRLKGEVSYTKVPTEKLKCFTETYGLMAEVCSLMTGIPRNKMTIGHLMYAIAELKGMKTDASRHNLDDNSSG